MRDIWLQSIRDLLAAIFLLPIAVACLALAIHTHEFSVRTHSTPGLPIIPFFYVLGFTTLGFAGWYFYSGITLPAYAIARQREDEAAEQDAAEHEGRFQKAAERYAENQSSAKERSMPNRS